LMLMPVTMRCRSSSWGRRARGSSSYSCRGQQQVQGYHSRQAPTLSWASSRQGSGQ
jgi:hypothetical protein